MVDAKFFMAAERNGHNGHIFEALRNRFPEIPEQVISQTLQSEHGNPERCLTILSAESNRILYGGTDVIDSPMPVQPSSQNTPTDEPITISIPSSTTPPYLPSRITPPLQPMMRPTTVAQPSPPSGYVSPGPADRPPSSSSAASYDLTLLCHQRQRLETLKKEILNERSKVSRLRRECQEKETEIIDVKFRVAANPTCTDVKHLRDENHVLREEIEHMTREIDGLSNGRDVVIGHPHNNPALTQYPSGYQVPVRRAESFPSSRPHSGTNGPVSGLQRFCSMFSTPPPHGEEGSPGSLSPPADEGSLEWEFLPPNHHHHHHSTVHRSEDTTWTCAVCTFANHDALEICEMCEMPRNRSLEARA
ncbi:mitogen-activated protein kinase kinase kinase 7-interacting protein 3 homolog isoform X1 [Montipora foliosa]|uniref:mitogen-activated protein kinase kinase kinase 7-interacting protein 3 homolog isoform X1 n=1 Tax=Montipora foliosa TaxID=591990 RepID=UPI0035F17DE1